MSKATLSKTEVVEGRKDDMKGKNFIVTGGNSGIGFALSKALVSRGGHVTIASRDPAKIAECVASSLPRHMSNSSYLGYAASASDECHLFC